MVPQINCNDLHCLGQDLANGPPVALGPKQAMQYKYGLSCPKFLIRQHSQISYINFTAKSKYMFSQEIQTAMFTAICRYKPVGIHRIFRIISIKRHVNGTMGTLFHFDDIVEFLNQFYDIDQLESLELPESDFQLPYNEYGELMEKCRSNEFGSVATTPDDTTDKKRKDPPKKKPAKKRKK